MGRTWGTRSLRKCATFHRSASPSACESTVVDSFHDLDFQAGVLFLCGRLGRRSLRGPRAFFGVLFFTNGGTNGRCAWVARREVILESEQRWELFFIFLIGVSAFLLVSFELQRVHVFPYFGSNLSFSLHRSLHTEAEAKQTTRSTDRWTRPRATAHHMSLPVSPPGIRQCKH